MLRFFIKDRYAGNKMSDTKITQLKIREDRPTALSSSAHGANLDAVAFNLIFLALRDPKLAVELLELYDRARHVKENDPKAPEEDFALFADEVAKLVDDSNK